MCTRRSRRQVFRRVLVDALAAALIGAGGLILITITRYLT